MSEFEASTVFRYGTEFTCFTVPILFVYVVSRGDHFNVPSEHDYLHSLWIPRWTISLSSLSFGFSSKRQIVSHNPRAVADDSYSIDSVIPLYYCNKLHCTYIDVIKNIIKILCSFLKHTWIQMLGTTTNERLGFTNIIQMCVFYVYLH